MQINTFWFGQVEKGGARAAYYDQDFKHRRNSFFQLALKEKRIWKAKENSPEENS
jgi:hypothetical protein